MAFTTVNKSTDYFNTKLYTGNNGTNAITGVGFQPDWVWLKPRNATDNHRLMNSVSTADKYLASNANSAETNTGSNFASFDSDGFTLGGSDGGWNSSSYNYVSWNWKAGTTGSGTTTGSGYGKAYSYSVNTTAGFSVITYKGNGTAGHTIPHHLGATPSFIIVKNRDDTQSWLVGTTILGWTKNLHLNENGAVETTTNIWNDTAPTSTVFTVGTNTKCNTNDEDYIAFVFAEKQGYSKFGAYTGTASTEGPFLYTGFRPSFVIIKRYNSANDWFVFDDKTSPRNPTNAYLRANTTASAGSYDWLDLVSNGIKIRNTSDGASGSGDSYVYYAFGQSLVGSNNIPSTAR